MVLNGSSVNAMILSTSVSIVAAFLLAIFLTISNLVALSVSVNKYDFGQAQIWYRFPNAQVHASHLLQQDFWLCFSY